MCWQGRWALIAIGWDRELGADLESAESLPKDDESLSKLAARVLSKRELQIWNAIPNQVKRREAFLRMWTRKEAYVKALGEGLSIPLDSFVVALAPGIPAALHYVEADASEVQRWSMYNIEVTEGYKAALVVEGKGHWLRQLDWKPTSGSKVC